MTVNKKLRGVSLLSAIFGELSTQLPKDSITTEELLQSAQKLIELSKKEYIPVDQAKAYRRDGYYSHDICTAFEKYQGRILENELRALSEPSIGGDTGYALKEILSGSRRDLVLGEIYA